MTATAVRESNRAKINTLALASDVKGKLDEESQEDLDNLLQEMASNNNTDKVGYLTKAFGKGQSNVNSLLPKIKNKAESLGLSVVQVGKGKDKKYIVYNGLSERSFDGANKLAQTQIRPIKSRRISKKGKSLKTKKSSNTLNSINKIRNNVEKRNPRRNNTVKSSKNKNIRRPSNLGSKKVLSRRPKKLNLFPEVGPAK